MFIGEKIFTVSCPRMNSLHFLVTDNIMWDVQRGITIQFSHNVLIQPPQISVSEIRSCNNIGILVKSRYQSDRDSWNLWSSLKK